MVNAWHNADGLYIKYGQDEGAVGKAGVFGDVELGTHIVEVDITLTSLSTSAQTILDDNVRIPKNYTLDKVEVIATTAATGTSSTLDIGFISADRSTEVDYDGAVAAMALTAIDAKGETVTLTKGGTGAGALVGTTVSTSAVSLLVAKSPTAFTAGVVKVRLWLRKN